MSGDNDDGVLADIETQLASDRAFARRVARTQSMMDSRGPSRDSMCTGGLLLLLSLIFIVADVWWSQPWLIFPSVAVFAVAMRPIVISMSRKQPNSDNDRKR